MTKEQLAKILDASFRARRVANALCYLDSALGSASEAGLNLAPVGGDTMRGHLMARLDRDAETAGFMPSEFYSKE